MLSLPLVQFAVGVVVERDGAEAVFVADVTGYFVQPRQRVVGQVQECSQLRNEQRPVVGRRPLHPLVVFIPNGALIRMRQVPECRFKVGVSWWRPTVPPLSVGERTQSLSRKRPFAGRGNLPWPELPSHKISESVQRHDPVAMLSAHPIRFGNQRIGSHMRNRCPCGGVMARNMAWNRLRQASAGAAPSLTPGTVPGRAGRRIPYGVADSGTSGRNRQGSHNPAERYTGPSARAGAAGRWSTGCR